MVGFACCYFNWMAKHFCPNSENQTELVLAYLAYLSYRIAPAFVPHLISRLDFCQSAHLRPQVWLGWQAFQLPLLPCSPQQSHLLRLPLAF